MSTNQQQPQRISIKQAVKELLEQGKSDEEIIAWLVKERPEVKNPRAYLRAVKSALRKEAQKQIQTTVGTNQAQPPAQLLPIQIEQVEVPKPQLKEGVKAEEEEEAEAVQIEIEIDEEALASMYRGIIEIIGIIAVGDDFVFPEAKARSRAKLLKKVIEKRGLAQLPWEELSLLGALAEDAMYVYQRVREKRAKQRAQSVTGASVGTNQDKEEERKEQTLVKPDLRDLRQRLQQIYKRAGV